MVFENRNQRIIGHKVVPHQIKFTAAAEAANAIAVTVNLYDYDGFTVDDFVACYFYISDTDGGPVAGDTVEQLAADGTYSYIIEEFTADQSGMIAIKNGGVITITESTGADTYYLNIVNAEGRIFTSDAIVFA